MRYIKKILFIFVIVCLSFIIEDNDAFAYSKSTSSGNFNINMSGDWIDRNHISFNFMFTNRNITNDFESSNYIILYNISSSLSGEEIMIFKAQLIKALKGISSRFNVIAIPIREIYSGYGDDYYNGHTNLNRAIDTGYFSEYDTFFWEDKIAKEQASDILYTNQTVNMTGSYSDSANFRIIYVNTSPLNNSIFSSNCLNYEQRGNLEYYYIQYKYLQTSDSCDDVFFADSDNLTQVFDQIVADKSENNHAIKFTIPKDFNDFEIESIEDISVSNVGKTIIEERVEETPNPNPSLDPIANTYYDISIHNFYPLANNTISIKLKVTDDYLNDTSKSSYTMNSSIDLKYGNTNNSFSTYNYIYKDKYKVYIDMNYTITEVNTLDFCGDGINRITEYYVGDVVHLDDLNRKCGNLHFVGWFIPYNGYLNFRSNPGLGDTNANFYDITKIDDNSFYMPNHNVYVTAIWSEEEIVKSADSDEIINSQVINDYSFPAVLGNGHKSIIFADTCWEYVETMNSGAVKLIFDGYPDDLGMCLDDRKAHSGIDDKIVLNLSNEYYYGTEYYYDYVRDKYILSGDVSKYTWNENNFSNLIGKYTCKSTDSYNSCDTLYLIDSYNSESDANAFEFSQNIRYDSIGKSAFNTSTRSLASVGYMYGDPYEYESSDVKTVREIVFSKPLDESYYFAPSYSHINDTFQFQAIDNPQLISSLENKQDLLWNYTFFEDDSSYIDDVVYYIVGVDSTNIYYLPIHIGQTLESITKKYYYDDNVYHNTSNGYYYLRGMDAYPDTYVTNVNWYQELSNNSNLLDYKYVCIGSSVCQQYYQFKEGDSTSVTYYDSYLYGNDVTYDNVTGKYTLVDTKQLVEVMGGNTSTVTPFAENRHYTCKSDSNTCDEVYYVVDSSGDNIIYITLQDGEEIDDVLEEMFYDKKYDSDIKKVVDEWYRVNLSEYSSYLMDLPFNQKLCPSINGSAFDPNSNSTYGISYNVECDRVENNYTVSNENGNGKLTYPIGIFTQGPTVRDSYYWIGNPSNSYTSGLNYLYTNYTENDTLSLYREETHFDSDIRPVIYLSPNVELVAGDGNDYHPYVVKDNSKTMNYYVSGKSYWSN